MNSEGRKLCMTVADNMAISIRMGRIASLIWVLREYESNQGWDAKASDVLELLDDEARAVTDDFDNAVQYAASEATS